jgi:hypothetical protein
MTDFLTMDPDELAQLFATSGADHYPTPLAATLASDASAGQSGAGNGSGGKFSSFLNNPLTNLGMSLLAGSGPSTTPRSLGQILAKGVGAAQQSQQNALQKQLMKMRLAQSLARLQALQGSMNPGDR